MRVIICGAGQVGYNIASYLAREENDVTVIDLQPSLVAQINDELDVNGIVGHASNPDVLKSAGATDADLIIAFTQSDEVNMVACQIAHSLFSVPKKIARVREQAYRDPAWANLFSRAHMPIDVIISPEDILAQEIYQRLSIPGTTFVVPLAENKAHIIGVSCDENCPILNTTLHQISALFSDLSFRIISILRKGKPIIPSPEEQILEDDEVYFVVDTDHLDRTMKAFGHDKEKARRIVIAGGGQIGLRLSKLLKENTKTNIKIIESNEERASYLSEQLPDVIVLHGNSLDNDILEEASIDHVETYVALTNDDESNILGSLLAKQSGCNRVITLVNNKSYSNLVGPKLGVDAIVSPRSTIVANIMQHVRRGRIKGLHSLGNGFAEVMEVEVSEAASVVNTDIEDLALPSDVVLGAIIRDDDVIIPDGKETIRARDHVIVLSSQEQAQEVEKMFSIQVDLF